MIRIISWENVKKAFANSGMGHVGESLCSCPICTLYAEIANSTVECPSKLFEAIHYALSLTSDDIDRMSEDSGVKLDEFLRRCREDQDSERGLDTDIVTRLEHYSPADDGETCDLTYEAAQEIKRLREAAEQNAAVIEKAVAWARWYGPWDSGNPDHIAGGDPDDELYNELVRWKRGVPRDNSTSDANDDAFGNFIRAMRNLGSPRSKS